MAVVYSKYPQCPLRGRSRAWGGAGATKGTHVLVTPLSTCGAKLQHCVSSASPLPVQGDTAGQGRAQPKATKAMRLNP